jgi:hypothetical protein
MAYNNVNHLSALVTKTDVIQTSFINSTVDLELIPTSIIKIAEIAHIEKPLGRPFYEELVIQNSAIMSAANTVLYDDYLKRCLCWYVKLEAMNEIQNQVSSSGVMTNIDDYSTKVSPAEFNLMKQDVHRKAQLFLQDMLDFLSDENNIGNYPTYRDNKHDSDTINDGSTNTKGGIIFY